MLKPLLKFSTTLIVWKLASTTERFILEKYSWFVVPDHRWSLQTHQTSGHQMNPNPIYHPLPRDTIVKPKARNKPERGGTRQSRDADAMPSSARKSGPDMNLIWPSIWEENQSKKPKKGVQLGEHTTFHTPRFKNWLKNSKLSLTPMKNKGALEKFSDQQPYGYKVERLI
jgi:hypothetical protein